MMPPKRRCKHSLPASHGRFESFAFEGPFLALLGRKLRYTKWLNLRQLLELSGHEMGCSSEGFGLKMTQLGQAG
jgi:hypothetical protein